MSWTLTAAISPRPTVRVAVVDAYGEAVNEFVGRRRVGGEEPDRPWAVYLAAPDRQFRLLAFDLDAKTPGAAAAAARDADVLTGLLTDVGLRPVVCQSGPTGGRHVWAALAEPADPETVATLARLARHVCPTLDVAPLSNPATGCVRPPGAPHRSGGRSMVLSGDLDALTAPSGTVAQVRALIQSLSRLVEDGEPAGTLELRRPVPLDEHGRRYLPGPRRQLPAVSAAALDEDAASGDASAVLWRVLIGAASARWRHADIAALAPTSPGLEHVRTYRDRSQRLPRGGRGAAEVLRRQWDKAVSYVATTGHRAGDDPTFDARADAIARLVRDVQSRADVAAGRWTQGSGPADRRVLDVLCVLALQAIRDSVEADTRRLALLAGVGRETARTSLLRLAGDGWIARAQAATGPHGAHWTIRPTGDVHRVPDEDRSQADPRPEGAGAAERLALLSTLTARTTDAAHDLFTTRPALGHLAGNAYARTHAEPQELQDIARSLGATPEVAALVLGRLVSAGVLLHGRGGWRRRGADSRKQAAIRLGVDGRLADRARRYSVERELWAWWQAEEAWMRAPRRPAASRRPGRGQMSLLPEFGTNAYGVHPRRPDGRADFRAARLEVEIARGGRALAKGTRVLEVDRPSQAEVLVRELLGARRIA